MKFEYTPENIEYVVDLIKRNLTPDLLKSRTIKDRNETNPMYGHCEHASTALVLLMDTDKLQLMYNRTTSSGHVWVQDGDTIYDITVDQFHRVGLDPFYGDYAYARVVPSRRTDILIERVLRTHQELSQSEFLDGSEDL